MRNLSLAALLVASASPAFANFAITQGAGTTVFAIDAANQGTSLCAASLTECYGAVPISAAGVPIGVNGAPFYVNATQNGSWTVSASGNFPVTGTFWQTTQPVSAASLPLPTGAASAANQEVTVAGTTASSAQGVQGVTGGVPLPISGSITASVGGFTPSSSGARMTQLAVTTSDTSGSLPTGAVVVVSNSGATNPMFCNVNGITATTSDQQIPIESWFAFTIPATVTTLHCIATGGSTTADGLGGSGLPTGAGGGSGGSGGGGGNVNITQVNGVTALAGAGATGTGSLRITAAQDTTTIAGSAPGTAGTPSANVVSIQGVSGGTAMPVSGTFWQTTQPISAASLPLPTGAATAANQEVTAAGTSASNAQGVQGVTGGVALPVSAASLPLPTGAATAGNQTSVISAAGSGAASAINVQGIAGGTAQPVSMAASSGVDGWNITEGTKGDAAYTSGSGSIVAVLKGIYSAATSPIATQASTVTIGAVGVIHNDTAPSTVNITAQDVASSSANQANSQAFVTGAPTASSTASFTLATGFDTARVLVTGTWTGTLAVEGSMDGGTTWVAQGVHQNGTNYAANSFTGNFEGPTPTAGLTNIRVRATAAWTGTATVRVVQTVNPGTIYVGNPGTIGVSATGAAVGPYASYAGMNVSGNLTGMTGTSNGLKVDGSAVTQPVSTTAYPTTAVPVTASATGTTAATTATLTNVSGHTTYICGFSIRANATAAATNNATVTGTITGTLNFTQWTAPLASGLGVTEEVFSPCVSASAVSTSIAVVSGAPGTGGVVSVSAWGFSI